MIEETIRNFLMESIPKPVYIDVPANPPAERIVIERTGGGMEEHIRNAQIAIQCYAETRYKAAELHELVMWAMPSLIELDSVSACYLNAEYDFTDTSTKEYRYQSVFDIYYYGGN